MNRIFLCLLALIAWGQVNARVNYVTVRTNYELGNNYQLGNQLFCIATALAYAWDHEFKAVFPFLNESGANREFNRDRIFFRLDTHLPRNIRTTHYDMSWRYHPIPHFRRDVMLIGPFMSWKYFHHHRDQILDTFAPSSDILDYLSP